MKTAVLLAALALSGCAAATQTALPAPLPAPPAGYTAWPQALHDPRHSATAGVAGPTAATVAWRRQLGGNVTPGPVLGADGTVYAASNAGVLYALNPATGATEWTFDAHGTYGSGGEADLSTSPAVLPDRRLLWPGPHDTLYGLSAQGHLLFSLPRQAAVLSPAVAGSTAFYLADQSGRLSYVTLAGNRPLVRWTLRVGRFSQGSPVIAPNGTVLQTADRGVVEVVNEGTRAAVGWRFTTRAAVEVSAGVAPDGTVVLGTDDGYEYGLSPSGRLRWKDFLGKGVYSFSSPAVTPAGVAYWGDNNGVLTVAQAGSGRVLRRDQAAGRPGHGSGSIWTAPAIDSSGDVYYGTNDGHVYGYSPAGRQLFDLHLGGVVDSYPAITATGLLVLGSSNGELVAVGTPRAAT